MNNKKTTTRRQLRQQPKKAKAKKINKKQTAGNDTWLKTIRCKFGIETRIMHRKKLKGEKSQQYSLFNTRSNRITTQLNIRIRK